MSEISSVDPGSNREPRDDRDVPRPFSELRDEGLLWYINRVAFHPFGFALAFTVEDDGTVSGWSMLGDGSECWTFTNDDDDAGFSASRAFLDARGGSCG